ncbi:hypothetical protein Tco_0754042 [Tanacetum coccineum]
MLAPGGGGLILYQVYGNSYAMTGRKAYLLEDKQIPSVGVFNEVSFYTLFRERGDGVTGIKRRRRDQSSDDVRNLATSSGRGQLKEDLESSTWCGNGYSQKDKNKAKTKQNRARDWKEREKPEPKINTKIQAQEKKPKQGLNVG